jgi:MFS family permease
MVLVGFPLLALSFTHSSAQIAGVAAAAQLPALVVGPPAGALADRLNRRRLLVVVELLRFGLLAAFAALFAAGLDSLAVLYLAAFLLGSLTMVFDSATAACVPTLVPPDLLVKGNSHLTAVDVTGEEMVGQALGGVVFSVASALPFAADAVSFLASAGLIRGAIPDNHPDPGRSASFLSDLRAGLRWFSGSPLIRLLTGLIAQLAFCQAVVLALLVLYARQDLHLSETGYGLLLGISAAANVVGAATVNRLHIRVGSGWSIIIAGVAAAVSYPILAATHSPFVACAALSLEAMSVTIGLVAARSLRQSAVPQEFQGRVASAYQTVIFAAFPIGALAGGLLATRLGIRGTFLLAGCLQLLVVGLTARALLVRIRRFWAHPDGSTSEAPGPKPGPATRHGPPPSPDGLSTAGRISPTRVDT